MLAHRTLVVLHRHLRGMSAGFVASDHFLAVSIAAIALHLFVHDAMVMLFEGVFA